MPTRVIYIPWKRTDAEELYSEALKWGTALEKEFHVLTKDSNDFSAMANLSAHEDVMYVSGHCNVGLEFMAPTPTSDDYVKPEMLAADSVLKAHLKTTFAGMIKFWACSSGAEGMFFGTSFARATAKTMLAAGWVNCTYYGYTQTVKSQPLPTPGGPGTDWHKRVMVGEKLRRASLYRTYVGGVVRLRDKAAAEGMVEREVSGGGCSVQ